MSHWMTAAETERSVSIAGKATFTTDSSTYAMLDARIVASSTQSLASAAQSPATRTDWMVPSSHGLDLTLGTRNCSSRPNSSRTLASFGLITHYLRVGYRSPAPLAMSALDQMCFVPCVDGSEL